MAWKAEVHWWVYFVFLNKDLDWSLRLCRSLWQWSLGNFLFQGQASLQVTALFLHLLFLYMPERVVNCCALTHSFVTSLTAFLKTLWSDRYSGFKKTSVLILILENKAVVSQDGSLLPSSWGTFSSFSFLSLAVLLVCHPLRAPWYFHKPLGLAKTTEKYSGVFVKFSFVYEGAC